MDGPEHGKKYMPKNKRFIPL